MKHCQPISQNAEQKRLSQVQPVASPCRRTALTNEESLLFMPESHKRKQALLIPSDMKGLFGAKTAPQHASDQSMHNADTEKVAAHVQNENIIA
ncbi:hypothetical protein PT974_04732 [Cladobotryum mycophilum]|uniref:Uncharacterized protein n=1 Tax=Cladobotryum mycophilum TaxID=491253 RepID=A0ABR0SRB0_9HYPO